MQHRRMICERRAELPGVGMFSLPSFAAAGSETGVKLGLHPVHRRRPVRVAKNALEMQAEHSDAELS
jgi:hypothetical protein